MYGAAQEGTQNIPTESWSCCLLAVSLRKSSKLGKLTLSPCSLPGSTKVQGIGKGLPQEAWLYLFQAGRHSMWMWFEVLLGAP